MNHAELHTAISNELIKHWPYLNGRAPESIECATCRNGFTWLTEAAIHSAAVIVALIDMEKVDA